MSVVYPLALPSHNFMRLELKMLSAIGRTVSPFSFREEVFAWEGTRWAASVTLPLLTRVQSDEWFAVLAALRGSYGTFLLGDPFRFVQRGSLAIADPAVGVVINQHAPVGYTLMTRGWTPSSVGVLLPGDMFQVGYGEFARLYTVTQQVDADGSGNATLDIWPRWRRDLSADTPTEKLTDPDFESWSGGLPTAWATSGPNTTFIEASTTPAPSAGARYLEMVKTTTDFAQANQVGVLGLTPGKPYRHRSHRGKNTTDSLQALTQFIINTTKGERLHTKRYSQMPGAVDGDVWVPNATGGSASRVGALIGDTWYKTEFGVFVPSAYAAGDTWQYMLGTTAAGGTNVYYDNAGLYGPSFDGMGLEFSTPKGVFRLRDNDPGVTTALTVHEVGFEALEVVP